MVDNASPSKTTEKVLFYSSKLPWFAQICGGLEEPQKVKYLILGPEWYLRYLQLGGCIRNDACARLNFTVVNFVSGKPN